MRAPHVVGAAWKWKEFGISGLRGLGFDVWFSGFEVSVLGTVALHKAFG